VLFLQAGPEMAVAASKTFVTQVTTLVVLAAGIAKLRGSLSEEAEAELVEGLNGLPAGAARALELNAPKAKDLARRYVNSRGFMYVGRGATYPAALEVLRVTTAAGRPLAELAEQIPLLPQEQRAVKVRHKEQWEGDPALQRAIADAERRLGNGGRVLVRPSGTEPALRVMVEGTDGDLVRELADDLSALAESRLH
jgi:phosphomannomutase